MSNCCPTFAPSIRVNVTPSGTGCLTAIPRDVDGNGLLTSLFVFLAADGQTLFEGMDSNGEFLAVEPSNSYVTVNGALLPRSDYTLTGSELTLNDPAEAQDVVAVQAFREPIVTKTTQELAERVEALEQLLGRFVDG